MHLQVPVLRNYPDLRFWLRPCISVFVAHTREVINPILFLPSSMSIYSPPLSAWTGLGMVCRSMYPPLQRPQPHSLSWYLSTSAAYLSLRKAALGMCLPALTCVEGTELAHLALAHPGGHTAFPWQVEKGAFLSKGYKICQRKNVSAHFTYCRGSRSKMDSLLRFPSKQSGKPLLFRQATKVVANSSHTLDNIFNRTLSCLTGPMLRFSLQALPGIAGWDWGS